jgi:hypothetical protein
MAEWEPDERKSVNADDLFLWIIPANAAGTWSWTTPAGVERTVVLRQQFQKVEGDGLNEVKLRGEELSFELDGGRYGGLVRGDTITGTLEKNGRRQRWTARRIGSSR